MDILKSLGNAIVNAFKFPKPYNWGYPLFYGAAGMGISMAMLLLLFSGMFPFSSTSLIGCAVIVLVIVMFAFVTPSVIIAEKCGLNVAGRYTGIGVLILSFLSGAPLYLMKASFHNLMTALWLKIGGTIVFPAVFYHVETENGLTLLLEILIDTVIPAFGFALFFFGAVWQGFTEKNKRLAYIVLPLLIALFSFDFLDIIGILIIGWWLCVVRDNTENIYGVILSLIGSRLTGILAGGIVSELDLTTIRTFSDIPSTFYYSTVPAIIIAAIMMAFFKKTLGEFHFTYSADIYGDDKHPEDTDGIKAGGIISGINLTLVLGVIICAVLWILLAKGIRI